MTTQESQEEIIINLKQKNEKLIKEIALLNDYHKKQYCDLYEKYTNCELEKQRIQLEFEYFKEAEAEEKRMAEDQRQAEEKRMAEDQRQAEEKRIAEEKYIAQISKLKEEISLIKEENKKLLETISKLNSGLEFHNGYIGALSEVNYLIKHKYKHENIKLFDKVFLKQKLAISCLNKIKRDITTCCSKIELCPAGSCDIITKSCFELTQSKSILDISSIDTKFGQFNITYGPDGTVFVHPKEDETTEDLGLDEESLIELEKQRMQSRTKSRKAH